MSSKSLYETFGNEVSYEQRRGKLVQFIENNTINFPLPEASIEILVNMIPGDFKGIDPSKVEPIPMNGSNINSPFFFCVKVN